LLGIQALLVVLVTLWPARRPNGVEKTLFDVRDREVGAREEVLPTRQALRRPPPPIPVAVPDDIVLETEPTFADGLESLDPSDDAVLAEGGGDLGAPAPRPDSGPRAIRFAEPEYPEEARRRGLRAEVVVEVEVNEKGRVVDTIVLERYVWDEDTKAPVERLDFGLEEAALAASTRWLFQPAREGGFPVRSRTALTFRFGL
jgi:hypothetical protein